MELRIEGHKVIVMKDEDFEVANVDWRPGTPESRAFRNVCNRYGILNFTRVEGKPMQRIEAAENCRLTERGEFKNQRADLEQCAHRLHAQLGGGVAFTVEYSRWRTEEYQDQILVLSEAAYRKLS